MPEEQSSTSDKKPQIEPSFPLVIGLLKAVQDSVDADRALINSNTERTRQLIKQYNQNAATQRAILNQLKDMQSSYSQSSNQLRRNLIVLFLIVEVAAIASDVLILAQHQVIAVVFRVIVTGAVGVTAFRWVNKLERSINSQSQERR